jgi:hypothetical protein
MLHASASVARRTREKPVFSAIGMGRRKQMDDHFPYSMFAADETWNRDEAYSCARWRQCEPERNLLAAVLKDALLIYRRRAPNRDARFKEVERWFFSEENERLFAFKPLCAMLNVNAENIRKDLRKWTEQPNFNRREELRVTRSGKIARRVN